MLIVRLSIRLGAVQNPFWSEFRIQKMTDQKKEKVISKEKAVFWLDKHGFWHNEHGKFQHKKIIDYFHTSINRDRDGYFLSQENEQFIEKVYFPHEDTALFVFNVIPGEEIVLVLNTKKQIKLDPEKLFMQNDSLYMHFGNEIIKFAEHGLLKIADLMENEDDRYFIRVKNKRYEVKRRD